MADDRIDIQIDDKVNPNISKKISAIGTEAKASASSIKLLKAELATLQSNSISTLNKAIGDNANATLKQASGNTKVATEATKATAAIDKEAAAMERLSAVSARAAARQEASAAATAAASARGGGLVGSRADAAASTALMAGTGAAVQAEVKTAETAIAGLESNTTPIFGRFKASAVNAFDAIRDAVTANGTRFQNGFLGVGGAAKLGEEAVAVEKVGHAAAGNSTAIRELFVLAREGGRGDFTRMAGSVSILAGALGLLETVLIPVALLLGTAAAGMKAFQLSVSSELTPQLAAYANSLGLSNKEMRKLGDETVGAEGKLKSFNTVTVTMGDVFHGFLTTAGEALSGFGDGVADTVNSIGINWANVWSSIKEITYAAVVGIAATVTTLASTLVTVFTNVAKIVYNAFAVLTNAVALAVQTAVNGVISAINYLSSKSNAIFGTTFGEIGKLDLGVTSVFQNMQKFSKVDIGGEFAKNVKKADGTLTAFSARWKQNTLQAGKDRLKEAADAIIANRNPAKGRHPRESDPKTKDDYIDDTNMKLDKEIASMSMLKDAREEQNKLDQIEEEFAKRRMPLNADEIKQFSDKIHAITQYKYQQQEMDRIYETSAGPQRTYNASIAAAKDLLDRGAISTRDYATEVAKASRTLALAKDPLLQYKEALADENALLNTWGSELKIATEVQSRYNQMRAADPTITAAILPGLRAEVIELQKKRDLQSQLTNALAPSLSAANPNQENETLLANKTNLYAEIERMRQADLLSDRSASIARADLDERLTRARLSNWTDMFGALAQLSQSSNKKIAAIGKAAAITQATIDGYLAVQKALASSPPPFNYIMAAAVGLTAALNVAKIAGFESGGYTGSGGTKEVAGVVHGREFVVNAQATLRNRNLLEAMNAGRGFEAGGYVAPPTQPLSQSVGSPNVNVSSGDTRVKVVNVTDPSEIPAAMDSEHGERVIFNVLARNPSKLKGLVNN